MVGRFVLRAVSKSVMCSQLGRKYAEAMKATVLDEYGKAVTMTMGCYGIGVSRIVAAAIEQNHDVAGIIWPAPIAPWQVAVCVINPKKIRSLLPLQNCFLLSCSLPMLIQYWMIVVCVLV